jgi:hypothetical protein
MLASRGDPKTCGSPAAMICLAVPALAAKAPCIGPEEACLQLAEANTDYVAAFNKQDPAAVAGFYAADAVFVTEGTILSGREAIQKEYAAAALIIEPLKSSG